MTAPIGSIRPAIAALRAALASSVELQRLQRSLPVGAGSVSVNATTQTRKSLVADLAEGLLRLEGDLEARRRAALRLFVQAVLCDEFGDGLQQDQEFSVLVDRVANAIEIAPDAHGLLQAAIDPLIGHRESAKK